MKRINLMSMNSRDHCRLDVIFIPCCLVLALMLVSCGGSNDAADGGMVLNAPLIMDIKGFDPAQSSDLYTHTAISQVYESPYQYSYLERPYQVEPLTAAAMPEFTSGGLLCRIRLKSGIHFHDNPCFTKTQGKGRLLTAHDYIFSFKRIADAREDSTGWWVFRDRIKGLDEFRKKTVSAEGLGVYDEPVAGLQAEDDHTLLIHLTSPYPQLVYILTMSFAAAIPREAVEYYGEEFLNHPVGTGPFIFREWIPNSRIVYDRNPDYHHDVYPSRGEENDRQINLLADAGKAVPFADRLVLRIMKERSAMWLEFMAGNLDHSTIPKDNYPDVIEGAGRLKASMSEKGIGIWIVPSLDLTYVAFNMKDPILGRCLALRQALSLCIDMDELIRNIYNGRAIRAHGPIPPNLSGYDPSFVNPMARYNLEEAREKMAQARRELGLKPEDVLEFTFDAQSNDVTARQLDEFFIHAFSEIGVRIRYNANDWTQYLDRIKNQKGQIWGAAWLGDYPDAENFLQLLYGPNEAPGSNDANYRNGDFDRLYTQMSLIPEGPERDALITRMVQIAVADCPWIFCSHRIIYSLHHGWLINFKYNDLSMNFYKYLRIDEEKKRELKKQL